MGVLPTHGAPLSRPGPSYPGHGAPLSRPGLSYPGHDPRPYGTQLSPSATVMRRLVEDYQAGHLQFGENNPYGRLASHLATHDRMGMLGKQDLGGVLARAGDFAMRFPNWSGGED